MSVDKWERVCRSRLTPEGSKNPTSTLLAWLGRRSNRGALLNRVRGEHRGLDPEMFACTAAMDGVGGGSSGTSSFSSLCLCCSGSDMADHYKDGHRVDERVWMQE